MAYIVIILAFVVVYSIYIYRKKNILYTQKIAPIICMTAFFPSLMKSAIEGYNLGAISMISVIMIVILMIAMAIWGYKTNSYRYYVNTDKRKEVVGFITSYLTKNKIKWQIENNELPRIYLTDIKKDITIFGFKTICLDFKKIRKESFYQGLVEELKIKVSNLD